MGIFSTKLRSHELKHIDNEVSRILGHSQEKLNTLKKLKDAVPKIKESTEDSKRNALKELERRERETIEEAKRRIRMLV